MGKPKEGASMKDQASAAPTNAAIIRMLESIRDDLRELKKRQAELTRSLEARERAARG